MLVEFTGLKYIELVEIIVIPQRHISPDIVIKVKTSVKRRKNLRQSLYVTEKRVLLHQVFLVVNLVLVFKPWVM